MAKSRQNDFVFTSDAVTPGHPDKLCDTISDGVLDQFLLEDPSSRLVAECAVSSGVVFVATRVASRANFDIAGVVRDVIADVGYGAGEFNAEDCSVMLSQAPFLSYALPSFDLDLLDAEAAGEITASNQTTLFGYACRQTDVYMPMPIVLAHRLARRLDGARQAGDLSYLTPDCQVQVAIAYADNRPVAVESINFLATQQNEQRPNQQQLHDDLMQIVVEPTLAAIDGGLTLDLKRLVVNPKGTLVGGGPVAHSGMTGRKVGIDTYGEYARQSTNALSGKDPIRIDRIGAYAARYVAKHVVAAEFADECEVQLSYSVVQPRPVSIRVRGYGKSRMGDSEIMRRVNQVFDLRPGIIAREMRLQRLPAERKGFFRDLSVYGHMGREDIDAPWERLDRLEQLKAG